MTIRAILDWNSHYGNTAPIPNEHPPSLKNPKRVPIPTAQDGWRKGDSKAARAQALQDLVLIHARLRRQIGKPEIAQTALIPNYAHFDVPRVY